MKISIPPKYEREMRRLRSRQKDMRFAAPLHTKEDDQEITSFVLNDDGFVEIIRVHKDDEDHIMMVGDYEESGSYDQWPPLVHGLMAMVVAMPPGDTTHH